MQVAAGYVLHIGSMAQGALRMGDSITAEVDQLRRRRIVPNHTFTHVLNFALREVPCCHGPCHLCQRLQPAQCK